MFLCNLELWRPFEFTVEGVPTPNVFIGTIPSCAIIGYSKDYSEVTFTSRINPYGPEKELVISAFDIRALHVTTLTSKKRPLFLGQFAYLTYLVSNGKYRTISGFVTHDPEHTDTLYILREGGFTLIQAASLLSIYGFGREQNDKFISDENSKHGSNISNFSVSKFLRDGNGFND